MHSFDRTSVFGFFPRTDLQVCVCVCVCVCARVENFLRQMAPSDPRARSLELRRAYRELSCLTQQRLAEILRSAEDNSKPN